MGPDIIKTCIASLAAILLAASCDNNRETPIENKIDAFATQDAENVLRAPVFGLSVKPPAGWVALDYEQLKQVYETGKASVSDRSDALRKAVEAGEENTYRIFMISRHETGAPVEENPNVVGVAESVAHAPDVKTGRDYFFHAKKIMAQANPAIEFATNYKTRTIGGVDFDQLDISTEASGARVRQSYYAHRYKDYMIVIIQSYASDEGERLTSDVLNAIELDW